MAGRATPPLDEQERPPGYTRGIALHRFDKELTRSEELFEQPTKRARTDDGPEFCAAVAGIDSVELPRADTYGLTFAEYKKLIAHADERHPGFRQWYDDKVLKSIEAPYVSNVSVVQEPVEELLKRFIAERKAKQNRQYAQQYVADRYVARRSVCAMKAHEEMEAVHEAHKSKKKNPRPSERIGISQNHPAIQHWVKTMQEFQEHVICSYMYTSLVPPPAEGKHYQLYCACDSIASKENYMAWMELLTVVYRSSLP